VKRVWIATKVIMIVIAFGWMCGAMDAIQKIRRRGATGASGFLDVFNPMLWI